MLYKFPRCLSVLFFPYLSTGHLSTYPLNSLEHPLESPSQILWKHSRVDYSAHRVGCNGDGRKKSHHRRNVMEKKHTDTNQKTMYRRTCQTVLVRPSSTCKTVFFVPIQKHGQTSGQKSNQQPGRTSRGGGDFVCRPYRLFIQQRVKTSFCLRESPRKTAVPLL